MAAPGFLKGFNKVPDDIQSRVPQSSTTERGAEAPDRSY
jgi:hypothetical protein